MALVPTIDCGCRSLLALDVTKAQDAPAVLASIDGLLMALFGTPAAVPLDLELRSDHGPLPSGAGSGDRSGCGGARLAASRRSWRQPRRRSARSTSRR